MQGRALSIKGLGLMSLIKYQGNYMIQCDYCGVLMGASNDLFKATRSHKCDNCTKEAEDNIRRAAEEE